MTVPLATVTQLRAQLLISGLQHDDSVELYLDAASNVVRGLVVVPDGEVPAEVVLATLHIADHLWDLRRRGSGEGRPGFGGGGGDDQVVVVRGYAVPRAAAQLLAGLPPASRSQSQPRWSFPPAHSFGDRRPTWHPDTW